MVEGWLSAAAPSHARGGVLSFYLVATKVAIVGAQMLLAQIGAGSPAWFELAGAVFTLSLIPVALTRTPQPPNISGPQRSIAWRRRVWLAASPPVSSTAPSSA